jgi:hypothetical protein
MRPEGPLDVGRVRADFVGDVFVLTRVLGVAVPDVLEQVDAPAVGPVVTNDTAALDHRHVADLALAVVDEASHP